MFSAELQRARLFTYASILLNRGTRLPPMYFQVLGQMKKHLGQLDKWFDATVTFAEGKSIDPNVFLGFRLAPDQFPFSRQVQLTCDTAKLATSRLTGKDAPVYPDTEASIEDLRARVRSIIAFLDTLTEADFEGAATRTVSHPRWGAKTLAGSDYFLEHAMPNFFFHLSHVYAILRHNGVSVGKHDYLGALSFRGE